MVADFKKLHVWQKAHAMALNAHRLAAEMRGPSNAALKNQLVRAAMSIPANIVEGSAKQSDREFARFIRIALGSASEMEYHLILASDTNAISHSAFESLLGELIDVRKMLTGLVKRLDRSAPRATNAAGAVPPVNSADSC